MAPPPMAIPAGLEHAQPELDEREVPEGTGLVRGAVAVVVLQPRQQRLVNQLPMTSATARPSEYPPVVAIFVSPPAGSLSCPGASSRGLDHPPSRGKQPGGGGGLV